MGGAWGVTWARARPGGAGAVRAIAPRLQLAVTLSGLVAAPSLGDR